MEEGWSPAVHYGRQRPLSIINRPGQEGVITVKERLGRGVMTRPPVRLSKESTKKSGVNEGGLGPAERRVQAGQDLSGHWPRALTAQPRPEPARLRPPLLGRSQCREEGVQAIRSCLAGS